MVGGAHVEDAVGASDFALGLDGIAQGLAELGRARPPGRPLSGESGAGDGFLDREGDDRVRGSHGLLAILAVTVLGLGIRRRNGPAARD